MRLPDILSRLVTILLHPLLMPVYCSLWLLYTPTPYSNMSLGLNIQTLVLVGVFACLIPLMAIGVFILSGRVSDLEMPTARERVEPLLCSALVIGGSLIFLISRVPRPVAGMLCGESIALFFAAFCSFFWKISLHAIGSGAFLSFVSVLGICYHQDFSFIAAIAFVAAGLTGWTRLYEEAHTPLQLFAGYMLGVAVMGIVMNFIMMRPVF